MMPAERDDWIVEIIGVQRGTDDVFLLLNRYLGGDAMDAEGEILRADVARGGAYDSALSTNDALASIWVGESGSVWSASANGNVVTTAPVNFPDPAAPDFVSEVVDADRYQWRSTRLPDLRRQGYVPNVTAIWGLTDDFVIAVTYEGTIYMWDGSAWSQHLTENEQILTAVHGRAREDVYAVGAHGHVFHFDGSAWTQIPYPGDGGESVLLTDLRVSETGEATIVATSGKILHGTRHGLEILVESGVEFHGIVPFQDHHLVSGGRDGVWSLKGNRVEQFMEGALVGGWDFDAGAAFVEPVQEDGPSFVSFEPELDPPWWRTTI